ncbi:glycosyl transferase [Rhodopseudomonas sp. B29]|uniref:glycosyl transferase n=1 Tax=Rhodopseudomonas sp. B29 TaxID=95607 RepID=UPI0003491B0C|nr:glycosyl transferase [Rhodopseudomonas sp. B29]
MTGASLITIALVAGALGCAGLTMVLMPLLRRYALARPNARSSHKVPTPQGAGIAVIAATLVVAEFASAVAAPSAGLPIWLLAATLLIAAVGAVDDLRPLGVLPRLGLQALAVAAVVFTLPSELRVVPALPLGLERAVAFIAGLWFVNLVNFMDGLDWITVAEVVPLSLTLAAFGWAGVLPTPAALLAAALGGAMLGFAPFNKPVAKVFLGDVGSLPIGLLLGWCLLQLAVLGHPAAALLLPLYYLADATVTLLRRMAKREQFWQAHRSHFYQQATDNGFSVLAVSGHVLATNIILAALAAISVAMNSLIVDGIALAVGAVIVALLLIRFATPRKA